MLCAKCHKHFKEDDFSYRYESDDEISYTYKDYSCSNCGHINSEYDMEEPVQDWYFTFGCGQKYQNCYHIIRGGFSQARKVMFERFGSRWAFQYESAEAAGVERWGLKLIN